MPLIFNIENVYNVFPWKKIILTYIKVYYFTSFFLFSFIYIQTASFYVHIFAKEVSQRKFSFPFMMMLVCFSYVLLLYKKILKIRFTYFYLIISTFFTFLKAHTETLEYNLSIYKYVFVFIFKFKTTKILLYSICTYIAK